VGQFVFPGFFVMGLGLNSNYGPINALRILSRGPQVKPSRTGLRATKF
jgi:hypothetical protein